MRRREFVAGLGSATAWTVAATAQQAGRTRRLAWMNSFPEDHPYAKDAVTAFRQGLLELGWVEGHNLQIVYRWYMGDPNALAEEAKRLVALSPDVIVVGGGASVTPLLAATHAIPLVFAHVNDPVGRGMVASLARPGGNATGFTNFEYQMSTKWLELLKQIAPDTTRVAVLGNFTAVDGDRQLQAIRSVAPSLGVEVSSVQARNAVETERGLAAFARSSKDGLIVTENLVTVLYHELIVTLAAQYRLPAMYFLRYYVAEGGLISYGPNDTIQWRNAASYVDRILKGEKPADLPVQQPTKYELVINRRTANSLGLAVPTQLETFADEVIG